MRGTTASSGKNLVEQLARVYVAIPAVTTVDERTTIAVQMEIAPCTYVLVGVEPRSVVAFDLEHPHEVVDVTWSQPEKRIPVGCFVAKGVAAERG